MADSLILMASIAVGVVVGFLLSYLILRLMEKREVARSYSMGKCPNCGQTTARTEDWVCQWCSYPLLSSSYKKVPKTYKRLKEERLYEPEPMFESETEPVLEFEQEPVPEPEREPKLAPEPKLEPEPIGIELTVEELLSAYQAGGVAADAKFMNKLLKLTGIVAMIDVKDMLDTHYIRLTGAERNLLQSVRCMFDKKHALTLKQLTIGQTVMVQGKYNGSIIAIRMVDCVLVR